MKIPASTYRLQLHEGFTLHDACEVVPYLHRLGATHVYLSPIFQSAPGSEHGYNVVDPNAVDVTRGGREGFERLRKACLELGIGIILDIVPNHMDISGPSNRYFWNVLRSGPRSESSAIFDIDWDDPDAGGRLVLPVLGRSLDEEIDDSAITIELRGSGICVSYYGHAWPLRPGSCASVLEHTASVGGASKARELSADLLACETGSVDESHIDAIQQRAVSLCEEHPEFKDALEQAIVHYSTPELLRSVIADQHYTPMQWETGGEVINYRRFFDIDTLIGVRVEEEAVFDETHRLILELAGLGGVDGLRVDHPDGLRDPGGYFERLALRAPSVWIVAEKILARDETLPDGWPVSGTSGYDFLNDALGVLVDRESEQAITGVYAENASDARPFHTTEIVCKRLAASDLLASDLRRLVNVGVRAAEQIDGNTLRAMLIEFAAHLPVYRIYTRQGESPTPKDRERLEHALAKAIDGSHFGQDQAKRVARTLLEPDESQVAQDFAARFQQYTAPATAKGVEDTAFYRDTRYVALNEVGGDPSQFGMCTEEFHDRVRARQAGWPHAMTTTSTHDTKRSEDVRARLSVVSEVPDRWEGWTRRWIEIIERCGRDGLLGEDLLLLFQTLLGAWPITRDRVEEYMTKAMRESKRSTRWRDIDEPYEEAMLQLIANLFNDQEAFDLIEAIVAEVLIPGRIKSLTQAVLRLSSPGVPDTYQGCELWDLSLVDPDNRRTVDYGVRRRLLESIGTLENDALWKSLVNPRDPGVSKLWTVSTLLRLRRDCHDVFSGDGTYTPIRVDGTSGDRVIALSRGIARDAASFVAILPTRGIADGTWGEVVLPEPSSGCWKNLCDDSTVKAGRVSVDQLFAIAPIAVLIDPEVFR